MPVCQEKFSILQFLRHVVKDADCCRFTFGNQGWTFTGVFHRSGSKAGAAPLEAQVCPLQIAPKFPGRALSGAVFRFPAAESAGTALWICERCKASAAVSQGLCRTCRRFSFKLRFVYNFVTFSPDKRVTIPVSLSIEFGLSPAGSPDRLPQKGNKTHGRFPRTAGGPRPL